MLREMIREEARPRDDVEAFFYFVFIATANRRWQFWGFMTILAYASGTAYLTFESLRNPIWAVLGSP